MADMTAQHQSKSLETAEKSGAFLDNREDESFATLRPVRARMRLLSKRPTTARMMRILRLLGLTRVQHDRWCGFLLRDWLRENPSWTEQQWAELVAENIDRIRSEPAA